MSNGAYLFGGPEETEVRCEKCEKYYRTTVWLAMFGSCKLCDPCGRKVRALYQSSKKKEGAQHD